MRSRTDRTPRPPGLGFGALLLTKLLRCPLRVLAFLRIFRVEVINRGSIPKKGAFILAGNHISIADPIYVWGALRRRIIALAMIELWKVPVLRWILNRLGHIPVDRKNRNTGATEKGVAVLEADGGLMVFPGAYCADELPELQPGVARMAFRTKAPIYAFGIRGTNKVKPRKTRLLHINPQARVRIKFSTTPIDPDDFDGPNRETDLLAELRKQIIALSA